MEVAMAATGPEHSITLSSGERAGEGSRSRKRWEGPAW